MFLYESLESSKPVTRIRSLLVKFVDLQVIIDGAIKLCEREELRFVRQGKSPSGFAAACVYLSSAVNGVKFTQSECAALFDVVEVTVRNNYQKIYSQLSEAEIYYICNQHKEIQIIRQKPKKKRRRTYIVWLHQRVSKGLDVVFDQVQEIKKPEYKSVIGNPVVESVFAIAVLLALSSISFMASIEEEEKYDG